MKRSFYKLICLSSFLFIAQWGGGLLTAQEMAAINSEPLLISSSNQTSLQQKNDLDQVLKTLQKEYKVFFTYSDKLVKGKKVTLPPFSGQRLETVLTDILPPIGLKHEKIRDQFYVITEKGKGRVNKREKRKARSKIKKQTKFSPVQSLSKSNAESLAPTVLPVSGTISDQSGEPLIGVNVLIKGSSLGTVTDVDGRFSLEVTNGDETLVISYIGYETQEVPINSQSVLQITLVENSATLDEIVVVGYGTQGKGKVSAAVSQVNGEDLQIDQRPVTNVQNSLVGSVPGLIINQTSGRPGQDISLRVRAVSALEQKNALVLIDGFEGSLNDVNPTDIASVTVLKDAAATAIYGARSANGVILITTKNTKRNEKMRFAYNSNYSIQSPAQTAELANSTQFMEFSNEAALNEAIRNNPGVDPSSVSLPFSNSDLSRAISGFYPETKWVDELYSENASQINQNFTIDGGTEKVGYFFNVGYLKQNGLIAGADNFQRFNLRLKVDADVTDWLTLGVNASNTNLNTDNVPGIENNNVRGRPFYPVQLEDGTYVDKGAAGGEANPVGRATSGSYDRDKQDAVNVQLYSQIKPIKDLTLEARVSYTNTNLFTEIWNTPYEFAFLDLELNRTGPNVPVNAADRNLSFRSNRIFSINTLSTARYEMDLNQQHHISLLTGLQTQQGESIFVQADRANFILPNLQDLTLGQTISDFGNTSGRGDNRTTLSYFGRLSYDFLSKYLLEFNFRADASSNFGPNNKWGYFPAVSVGWNIAEEGFLSDARFVDVFKLRASWGQNGDDGSINAIENVVFNPSGTAFGGNVAPTLNLGSAINPDLKWETSEKVNLGLDLVLWRGKLGATVEYFTDKRSDIITQLLTSVEGGLDGVLDNVYDAKSWGWELELSHSNKIGQFNYFANTNLTYYDSEITNTEGVSPLNNSNTNFQDIGLPVFGNWYGYETDGFFDSQSEIDASTIDQSSVVSQGDELGRYLGAFKYIDQNGDGIVNTDDRVVLKENTSDNYRIGFNLGVSYKGFTLSSRFYGVLKGYQWWRNGTNLNPFTGDVAPFVYQMNTWRPDNLDAIFPSATASNIIPFNQNASHLIQNNAYVKLKNISLGYSFDQDVLDKLKGLTGLDIYFSVENLGVIWANNPSFDTGWDPEFQTGTFRYPLPITASIGANVKF